MSTRDDNLKQLSNLLPAEKFARILEKSYSDDVLEYISNYAPTAEIFSDTKYSLKTVEKLMKAYKDNSIDTYDLMDLMEESLHHNRNERYIDDFAESVNIENHHDTYAAFRTSNVTDFSYSDIILGIHQGVYEANSIGMVQMDRELSKEMFDMGISLVVCEDNDYFSDLLNFENAYSDNSFVPVQKHRLAMEIQQMRHKPDWSDFRDYISSQMGGNGDKLTPYILGNMYLSFQKEVYKSKFADKVAGEYEQFISDLKKKDPDVIIRSAYEIYNKDYIVDFCNTNDLNLDLEEIQILLDTDNVLDEIYQEWDSMTQLNGLAEIDTAIEDTAYRLKSEAEQRKAEEMKKSAEGLDNTPAPAKPKRKPRL